MAEVLRDKVVFITGASSGIGAATARAFAEHGARLLLCARRLDRLQAMEAELRDKGASDFFAFELDVQDRDEVEGTINTLPDAWSCIDILVNNAGLSRGLTKLWEDDVQNWEEMIDTNVKGLLYVTRTVVPGMVNRGRGHVINLGSIAGHITYPNGHVYCATKAAEHSISEGLRIDLNGTPIRVTSIDPGPGGDGLQHGAFPRRRRTREKGLHRCASADAGRHRRHHRLERNAAPTCTDPDDDPDPRCAGESLRDEAR